MIAWVASAWAADVVHLTTSDGADVALHHTPGPGAPVVLVHGISCNARFFDLDAGPSLVRALSDAGFDVWAVDLRGHGDAARPAVAATLEDYGLRDVPAVLTHVRDATGRAPLYIGHSMGGIVLAIALAAGPDDLPLQGAVVVGSPLDFRDPDAFVRAIDAVAPVARRVPSPSGARLLALSGRDTLLHFDELLQNRDNLARPTEIELLRTAVSPISPAVLSAFAAAARDGEIRDPAGTPYREQLGGVTVPVLVLAGRADRIASADRVWSWFDAVGSPDKTFVVASVASQMHADYGHLDLIVGDHAAEDVYPRIVAWLDAHADGATAAAQPAATP